jgi:hypothetical protein
MDRRDGIGQSAAKGQRRREGEIGGIVDVYQRKIGNKALLFDEIPGFPGGGRGALGKKGH